MSVTQFICDFIKNLAPLCDATDEHRVVMAFPVVVIYQKGSDDITICGKGNYKSLIFRLKSFYGFYNKNFYTSQRKKSEPSLPFEFVMSFESSIAIINYIHTSCYCSIV